MRSEHHREILDSFWNHHDILLLALAYLPRGINKLTADYGQWGQLISEAKQSTKGAALLAAVHFRKRPPLPPFSDQLEEFFRIVGVSGTLTPSGYTAFYLSEKTKKRIKERRESKLDQHLDAIRQISARLQGLAAP